MSIASSTYIYVESDNNVKITGLRDALDNSYVNDAVIKASLCVDTPTSFNAAAVVDNVDDVTFSCTGHGLLVGDKIRIIGTINYDGEYTVTAKTTDTFDVTAVYVAETISILALFYKVVLNGYQITLAYKAASNGEYNGVLPDTMLIYAGTLYCLFISGSSGGNVFLIKSIVTAAFKS